MLVVRSLVRSSSYWQRQPDSQTMQDSALPAFCAFFLSWSSASKWPALRRLHCTDSPGHVSVCLVPCHRLRLPRMPLGREHGTLILMASGTPPSLPCPLGIWLQLLSKSHPCLGIDPLTIPSVGQLNSAPSEPTEFGLPARRGCGSVSGQRDLLPGPPP